MVVAPNGVVVLAQSTMKQEELVVADIDIGQATRAMFLDDMAGSSEMLFAVIEQNTAG